MTIKQIIISIILLLAVYGFLIEPNLITVKKLTLKSDEIKDLRIVFVSDFHLSKQAGSRLNRIIKKVNEQNPDIIISNDLKKIIKQNLEKVKEDLSLKLSQ